MNRRASGSMADDDEKTIEKEDDKYKPPKKRGHKLKKKTERRTAFDGRKVVFVTDFTQTDWEWKDKAEKSGKGAIVAASTAATSADTTSATSSRNAAQKPAMAKEIGKSDSQLSFDQSQREMEVRQPTKTVTDLAPLFFFPNDEFGLPMAEISSDSDSSEEDLYHEPKYYKHHLPSVGPPQILKYIRESDMQEMKSESEVSIMEASALNLHGIPAEMFSGICEFCGSDVKSFPTLDQQLSEPPESLYCCQEYRDFVEFALNSTARLEEELMKSTQQISVKVHPHFGSTQERQLAKEKAAQRMRERAEQRREQEANQAHTSFNQAGTAAFGTVSFAIGTVNAAPTASLNTASVGAGEHLTEETAQLKDVDFQDREDGLLIESAAVNESSAVNKSTAVNKSSAVNKSTAGNETEEGKNKDDGRENDKIKKPDRKSRLQKKGKDETFGLEESKNKIRGQQNEKGKRNDFGIYGKVKVTEGKFGERGDHSGRVRGQIEVARAGQLNHNFSFGIAPASAASFSSFQPLNIEVARQMKTINYQLSSQRCLEEGWTLRPPSPLETDDLEVFIPEPLHPAMIATGKLNDRPLVEQFYPDGSKFLTIFPDGTGNVFYPSGRLSIIISSISLGQNTYVVQDDSDQPTVLAVFDPSGVGSCSFSSGKVRLTFDQTSGLELDFDGGRKKAWSWRDQESHVHVPPFQPIVFGLNSFLGIRFMAQDNIALTLTGRRRSCRFNVGARLKPIPAESINPRAVEDHQLVIREHKVKVETLLSKITNFLKFPKSPKVDYILPPLSVSSQKQKLDKMKLTSASTSRKQHQVKQIKLPSLDSSVVSVS